MNVRPSLDRRRGGVTIWIVLLVLPLFALVAFGVDLNYIWTADAELQSAADAAALAGAERLLGPTTTASMPTTSAAEWGTVANLAEQDAVSAARARAATETVVGAPVVLNASDVEFGYVQDPASSPDAPAGQFQSPSNGCFPNSVRVTTRLDGTVPAGPLQLCFGPLLGTPSVARLAKATASLRGQNVTGFSGPGGRLLPIAMSLDARNALLGRVSDPSGNIGEGTGSLLSILNLLGQLGLPAPPPGVSTQDNFTVTLPIAGGAQPPANVSPGADMIPEAAVSPNKTRPGDFYLVSLRSAVVSNSATYVNWILNGPSAADLASFGSKGLQAGALAPATMYTGPNVSSTVNGALRSIVGQTRIVPVYSTYNPAGPSYQVIGFVAVVVVNVNLLGANPTMTLQPTATLDPSATLGGGVAVGSAAFVYQRVAISR